MHALTATRFFAAVLIVLHHSVGNFGITREMLHGAATGMGVSYFFVLSGFILTYVYPTLTEQRNVAKFIVARIARLWPLHVTTLFITILLFPHEFRIATFLANLFMVHAWIPDWNYFFSYNWLSWAISTELGFYLCFPVLIYGLDRNWRMKVSLAFGVILLFTYLCKDLPMGSSSQIGFLGFIMINPIGRMHEFMVGIVAALAYRKVVHSYRPTIITGTVVEIFSLISVLGIIFYNYGNENYLYPKSAFSQWFNQGGIACLLFGLFIFVIALQKGMLSRVLAIRTLRLLGEISFSIYMIHQLILRWYLINLASKVDIPQGFAYVLFWLCIVFVSYLLWRVVEKPCRNYIVKFCSRRFFLVKTAEEER